MHIKSFKSSNLRNISVYTLLPGTTTLLKLKSITPVRTLSISAGKYKEQKVYGLIIRELRV